MTEQEKTVLMKLLAKLAVDDEPKSVASSVKSDAAVASEYPDLLTVPQLAKFMQVGLSKAYEMTGWRDFPIMKIGRAIRVPKKSLLEWIDKQQQPSGLLNLKASGLRGR